MAMRHSKSFDKPSFCLKPFGVGGVIFSFWYLSQLISSDFPAVSWCQLLLPEFLCGISCWSLKWTVNRVMQTLILLAQVKSDGVTSSVCCMRPVGSPSAGLSCQCWSHGYFTATTTESPRLKLIWALLSWF